MDTNPSLRQRLLSKRKVGGLAALEQFLNHPLARFIMAAIANWQTQNECSAGFS